MGGKTTTSTNTVKIPQEVLDRYNAVNARAAQVAKTPFERYGQDESDFVAQFNEQQKQGVAGINRVADMGASYNNVEKYLNPYIKNVADTTRAQMEQANEQAQSGALGTAVSSGAFGGDRAGVAAANLSNQQNMAMGSTMANIYNQGYGQAMDASMADMNRMLGVAGQQLGAGTQMQQTKQAGLDALINQFMQEKGYDFQTAQFEANIAMGTGALSGSTTTSVQPGSFFSDRRLKHDIKEIGKAHNKMPIYTFKYKGDPEQHTHVGFMADEVEKKNPEAVGLDPSGYKTVDYDKATQSMGGGVKPHHGGEAFADGGVAGPYGSKVGQQVGMGSYIPDAYLPVGELMVADPNMAAQTQQSALDVLNSAATAGKNVLSLKDTYDKFNKAQGGVAGGYAGGGGVQPEKHEDYLSSTLASQSANRQKPELKTAAPSEPPESTFGSIVKLASTVAPFFLATGGVAGDRHGYATDGVVLTPEQESAQRMRDSLRQSLGSVYGNTDDMRQPSPLARNEVPTAQTLGSLPEAKVESAATVPPSVSAPSLQGLGGVDALRGMSAKPDAYKAESMRKFLSGAPAPTGVAAPTADQKPMPRPEGLGAAAAPTDMTASPSIRKIANVIGGGNGFTDVVYTDGTRERKQGDLNFRNNNPGNMEYGDLAKSYGAVGTDGRFAVFPDYETGRKAQEALLFQSGVYEGKTIGSAIAKYAPLGDGSNDPASYARNVASALGVPVDTPLSALTPEQRSAMLTAMEKQEGGSGGPSTYSSTPIGADGATLPPQGGIIGGAGMNTMGATSDGVGLSTRGLGPAVGVKPYEDRNALGKIVYNEDGTMNKNAMLSLAAGLGDMLSSQSPFLLPSIGAGISGAANTYMNRESQLANIAQTQAETNRTNILAASERFFPVGPNGIPLVTLLDGGTATLGEYLSNPELRASGNPEMEAQIRAAAREKLSSESGTVFNTPMVSDALEKERAGSTMNYAAAQAETSNMLQTFGASSEAARASTPSLLNQVKATSGMDTSGVFQAYRSEAVRVANDILRLAGQEPISADATDAQILQKAGVLRALDMASGSGQSAAQALDTILAVQPNQQLEPETNAKIMASLLMANQRAIDMNGFVREYQDLNGNTTRTTTQAPTAFGDIYARQYLSEEKALEKIVLEGSNPINNQGDTILSVISDPRLNTSQKNQIVSSFLMKKGMSEAEIANLGDVSRYFGG